METLEPVELAPQNARIRKLQHQIIERYNFRSESIGEEPYRRVRILP
jgi:predicted RNA-binding protein Jag